MPSGRFPRRRRDGGPHPDAARIGGQGEYALSQLADPALSQAALDAQLAFEEAEADLKNTEVKLESDLMAQKSSAATVDADYQQAERQAQTDKALYKLGVISGLAYQGSQGNADHCARGMAWNSRRSISIRRPIVSQLEVQKAKVAQAKALADLKQQQLDALTVKAGIDGVLTDLPLAVGQSVSVGTMLAKVVEPNQLKAELKIAETQARDIQIGQPASVDTHNGVIQERFPESIRPCRTETVTVDVKLSGEMPQGARPDLSVDGTIDLERLADVPLCGAARFWR